MESRALASFGASAVATLGYALVSAKVAKNETWDEDLKARREVVDHSTNGAKKAAQATHHIGKWYWNAPLGLAAGALLASRGKRAAGATIAFVGITAPIAKEVLDRVMKWRQPPPGKPKQSDTSFPSGHALETTAVGLTTAWILAREGLARGWVVGPIAACAAAISGLGRLVLDRHSSTDLAAGACAGLALGCASAGAYELGSRRLRGG